VYYQQQQQAISMRQALQQGMMNNGNDRQASPTMNQSHLKDSPSMAQGIFVFF
jgi:hypothetical protein